MDEVEARETLVEIAHSLFLRGYAVGSAGNISVAVDDGYLVTPTNSSLGRLRPDRISRLDRAWRHAGGDFPSKELPLHRAFYETRPSTRAVVHLHSTYATALSCLVNVDPQDALPPLTPYAVMRLGRVKLVSYSRPGSERTAELIRELNGAHAAVLLANHGIVVSGRDLLAAVHAAEELEETAKLLAIIGGQPHQVLTAEQVSELTPI
jgi:3-dehydro-4-phosphotetronate decarboxylase